MVMATCGTFRYSVVLPPDLHNQTAAWPMQLAEEIPRSGDSLETPRLVGHSPSLRIDDSGSTAPKGFEISNVHTACLTLLANRKRNATVAKASLFVSNGLFLALRPGDELYLTQDCCCGLGLSVLRADQLAFAVGAISLVPLGEGIRVSFPGMDRWRKNRQTIKSERPLHQEIEVAVGEESFTGYSGQAQLGEYELCVIHGYRVNEPGDRECASITRAGACSLRDAEISARLLDHGVPKLVQW